MNELKETIDNICDDFADINAILAALQESWTDVRPLIKKSANRFKIC